jgi:hypothetical protein
MVPNLSRWGRTPELAVVVVGALVVTLLALYYQYNLVILPVQGLTP